jgi:hypothetical protein
VKYNNKIGTLENNAMSDYAKSHSVSIIHSEITEGYESDGNL